MSSFWPSLKTLHDRCPSKGLRLALPHVRRTHLNRGKNGRAQGKSVKTYLRTQTTCPHARDKLQQLLSYISLVRDMKGRFAHDEKNASKRSPLTATSPSLEDETCPFFPHRLIEGHTWSNHFRGLLRTTRNMCVLLHSTTMLAISDCELTLTM